MLEGPTADSQSAESLFLSHLSTIERAIAFVCARQHLSSTEADEFASHVKLRLIDDEYAVVRQFEGRSSFPTFITVVIQRLLLDYRTSLWGKWRPSAEACRSGSVAVLLERLLVRDGHTLDEAFELLRTNHGVVVERAEVERLAGRLPWRSRRRFESDEQLAAMPSSGPPPDSSLTEHDRDRTAARVSEALGRLMSNLSVQDQLILAMRFDDGRTVAEIAGTLRLEPKPLYRRVERLLKDFRTLLEAEGIGADQARTILGAPTLAIDWEQAAPENIYRRPSLEKGARHGGD